MDTKKIRTPIAAILLTICLILPRLISNTGLSILGTFSLLATAFVCIILFAKKHDSLLVIALGVQAFVSLASVIYSPSIGSLIDLLTGVFILGLALVNCEQTLLKLDLSKYKALINKFFFIPAILSAITVVLDYSRLLDASYLHTFFNIANFYDPLWRLFAGFLVSSMLDTVAMLLLAFWLKDPYKKETAQQTKYTDNSNCTDYDEAYCSLGKHILLCLFTFGIWTLIWTYRTTKFLNKAPNAIQYSPAKKLLLCMFVPFYQIYWFYKHGQRIDALSKEKKFNTSDMATLCLILGIFIPIVACILMQDKINTLCAAKEPIAEEKNEGSTEELRKYKELFDQGVITEEEFTAKKKQLLDL